MKGTFLSIETVNIYHDKIFSSKFFVVMSGRFAYIFLSVLIVKSHRIVTSVVSVTGRNVCSYHFSVLRRLKFLNNIQCMFIPFFCVGQVEVFT